MDILGQYALRVIVGALICGILLSMVPEGAYEKLLRLLCGVFLTVILLSPLIKIDWEPNLDFFADVLDEGKRQAAVGEDLARQETERIISQRLEAYILDKAGQKGADLHVMVILDADGLPVKAELRGEVTEQARQELSDIMEDALGIAKENQLWMK